jgi:DNA replication protein DnaC
MLKEARRFIADLWASREPRWLSFLKKLRGGDYFEVDDVADTNLLLVDDIGTSSDTAFSLEQLYTILERRNRKWTVLTSNLSLREIAERMDTRIASRMIRDENVAVNVSVTDYAIRKRLMQKGQVV